VKTSGPVGSANPDQEHDGPLFVWTGDGEGELLDVSKPIAFDEHGNPLYAPRGSQTDRWGPALAHLQALP